MRVRTCKKCFTNCGYYPEWINGSPYCPECASKKKQEIADKRGESDDFAGGAAG